MSRCSLFLVVAALLLPLTAVSRSEDAASTESFAFAPTDWPWWRGPARTGAAPAQNPPLKWSNSENILWKAPIPGRGHGSPTIVGDQIFLATADAERQVQSVICLDRKTGQQRWETIVHRGTIDKKGHAKNSQASCTIACDGVNLFVNFLHAGAVYATSLDRNGKQLWQKKIGDFIVHQGFGSSPAIYGSLVIISADNKGGGIIAALDRGSGERVWKVDRPKLPNYTSPIILKVAGRDQLLLTGCDLVTSLNPLTGEKLWEIKGATTECVTSTVSDGNLIFTSGGYPKNHMSAVRADGSAKIVWENNTRIYVPSMLSHAGHLYAVLDEGSAVCWKADTGKEVWRERLGGTFSSSPVLVGETIFATNESGKTYIFKATPEGYEDLGRNQLGEDVFATPTIIGDRIYTRIGETKNDRRQEMLYCIGSK